MKLSALQIVAIIFIALYLVWEWNIQVYLSANGLTNNVDTRVDLFVILPVLVLLIGISLRQKFKK